MWISEGSSLRACQGLRTLAKRAEHPGCPALPIPLPSLSQAGGIITAVLGLIMMPWKLVSSTHGFVNTWLIGEWGWGRGGGGGKTCACRSAAAPVACPP